MSVKKYRFANTQYDGMVSTVLQLWAGLKRFTNGYALDQTAPIQGSSTFPALANENQFRAVYNLQRTPTSGNADFTLPMLDQNHEGRIIEFCTSQTPKPEINQAIRLVAGAGVTINSASVYNFLALNQTVRLRFENTSPTTGLYRILNEYIPQAGRILNATGNTTLGAGVLSHSCTRYVVDTVTTGNTLLMPVNAVFDGQEIEILNTTATTHSVLITNTDLAVAKPIVQNGNAIFKWSNSANKWLLIK